MKTYANLYRSIDDVRLRDVVGWKLAGWWKRTPPPAYLPMLRYMPFELHGKEDFVCWLSHATVLVQFEGKRFLFDPVFGHIPFYRRQLPTPYAPYDLGVIDAVLISHAHYDHLDKPSLKDLRNQSATLVVPKGTRRVVASCVPKTESIEEMLWYQTLHIGDVNITFVPARHWSSRTFFDKHKMLWGGYLLHTNNKTLYFSGDTAFGPHFEEIARRFDIDLAVLPIGAYEPRAVMKHNHLTPEEALKAADILGASYLLPVHYATFRLSDEALHEPLERLRRVKHRYDVETLEALPGEVVRWDDLTTP